MSFRLQNIKFFSLIFLLSLITPPTLHAEILKDNLELAIEGKSIFATVYNYKRKMLVAINTESELNYFSRIELPFNFDKSYIHQNSKIKNFGIYLDQTQIRTFEVTKNATSIPYEQSTKEITSLILTTQDLGSYKHYLFETKKIAIGDTLSINISYAIPMSSNLEIFTNHRIFFSDKVAKKTFSFTLSYENSACVTFKTFNTKDNTEKKTTEDKYQTITWQVNNLPENIFDEKAYPYKSAPYIQLTNKADYCYYRPPSSAALEELPSFVQPVEYREKDFLKQLQLSRIEAKTIDENNVRKFMKETCEGIEDDSSYTQTLFNIKTTIANELIYENDEAYYKLREKPLNHTGRDALNNVLKDRNRFLIYYSILSKLDLTLFTGYLCDKRSGEISEEFVYPIFKDNLLLVPIPKNGVPRFILPKKDDDVYYLDELPFYYENTSLMLVHVNDYRNRFDPIKKEARIIKTPKSSVKDNKRLHNIKLDLDLDLLSIKASGKITLSGQYSTLTRNVYADKSIDPTIHPDYGERVWESMRAMLVSKKISQSEYTFPYTHSIEVEFKHPTALSTAQDTTILPICGFFTHITDSTNLLERTMDYYPDFEGSDRFNYMINLNQDMELINDYNELIDNEYFTYNMVAKQINPRAIQLSSFVMMKSDYIPKSEKEALHQLQQMMVNANKIKLKLVPQEGVNASLPRNKP